MNSKLLKLIAPVLFFANLAAILIIWWQSALPEIQSDIIAGPLIAFGRLAGLSAFYLILWQLLLIGRTGWIERYWGHDRLSHLHHIIGITAVGILVAHPILLTIGYSRLAQTTLVNQFLQFAFHYPDILRAVLAYFMFLGIIFLSLYTVSKHLRYEIWYFIHVTLYIAVLCAFGHQLTNGHDLVGGGIFSIYWQVLFWGVLATVLYYRALKPAWNFRKYQFHVERIVRESSNVNSVVISGRGLDRFKAQAGQFIIVRFWVSGFWWEAHPFSLSEMPSGRRLRITPKAIGDFTRKISILKPDTRVIIEGPLGRFTADRAKQEKILLIAGGIGITPLRSLFEQFVKNDRTVDLIYAAQSEQDFALKSELDSLAGGKARIHYFPGDKTGNLTPEIIKNAVPDVAQRSVFLCGPPPMMKVVREYLKKLGTPESEVFYEKFRLG